ncbi:hypothetical protein KFK09_019344 [Dendrobium nobile]|uniref:RRM domain-containing protein n=1 Tax=Dendrobium nobile TaxID=94219 RepID=A0A8T3AQU7_DENNO|nr:hypothetical protein KFK09_019344 [Dendrobium nobile]
MPPRKKKTAKTPQKTKSSTPSSTAATINPTPTPPEPSLTSDAAAFNDLSVENDQRPLPETGHVPEPEPEPEGEIANELDVNPSREPEAIATAPEASEPAAEEVPEAPGVNTAETTTAEPIEKPSTKTVLRVRKVVRKKIVKKLVPKGSVAAKKVDDLPELDDLVSSRETSEKDLNPNSVLDSSIQQDATKEAFKPDAFQQLEPVNPVPEAEDNVEIKEKCLQMEAKDDVLKTRKVVRKKIVKKLVPKGSLGAKKVDAEPLQDGIVSLGENTEKYLNPNSALPSTIQQDAPVMTFNPDDNQQPEVKMEEDNKLESGKSDDNLEIKEECGQMESKDDNLESGKEGDGLEAAVVEQEVMGLSERMKRRKAEIFIGGLDRDAKEEDIRSVFGKVGEILELRMMMDGQTGKNKGYAFLRYVEPSQAKRAVAEFAKVEIRGKICGAAAVQGNDTIFLGNIDKKWKKEDLSNILKEGGIENIDAITVVMDPKNTDCNRGFAFLELETNRDAQRAFKKLQMKDALGKGRNIKVSWADSFRIPDEEDMQKVKSVYVEGAPDSWDEDRLKETFKKFGEIERIVLGRNIKSTKRRDIAFINYKTREAALSCVESFSSDELLDNGSKVSLKVALAKRMQKANQNKGQKSTINNSLKEIYKPAQDGMYSDLRGYPRARLNSNFGISGSSYAMMPPGGVSSSLHYQHQSVPVGYSTGSFYRSGSNTDAYQIRQGVPPYSSSSLYHRYQM